MTARCNAYGVSCVVEEVLRKARSGFDLDRIVFCGSSRLKHSVDIDWFKASHQTGGNHFDGSVGKGLYKRAAAPYSGKKTAGDFRQAALGKSAVEIASLRVAAEELFWNAGEILAA